MHGEKEDFIEDEGYQIEEEQVEEIGFGDEVYQ